MSRDPIPCRNVSARNVSDWSADLSLAEELTPTAFGTEPEAAGAELNVAVNTCESCGGVDRSQRPPEMLGLVLVGDERERPLGMLEQADNVLRG